MKWSFYNIITNNEGRYLLYNCLNEKVLLLEQNIKLFLEENSQNVNNIMYLHPDLYDCLCNEKFVVDESLDEVNYFLSQVKGSDTSSEYFNLIINPTLDCNLNCWYCYENHILNSSMSAEKVNAIKLLVRNKIINDDLKYFYLSFFGGEPLLEVKRLVLPLVDCFKKMCAENEIVFKCSFTTNASLLTPNITDNLYETGVEIHFQVPFDGNREYHDIVKKYTNGRGSYSNVINNVRYALDKDFDFTIRCNYTKDNILSFIDLIDDLKLYSNKNNLRFSFQKIWQEAEDDSMRDDVNRVISYLKESGFVKPVKIVGLPKCYADRENSVVVNYNGDVYKCTANDFISKEREGVLNLDGSITYNELYEERIAAKYTLEQCLDCKIFPICPACSRDRVNMKRGMKCRYENNILNLVNDRIGKIIEK